MVIGEWNAIIMAWPRPVLKGARSEVYARSIRGISQGLRGLLKGHCVDQRMIVQRLLLHHCGVEHHSNPALCVIDGTEGGDSPGFYTEHLAQEIG